MGDGANDDEERHEQRLMLLVRPSWVEAVDKWRRKQPDLPNRSEAIRRLVEMALDQL